VKVLKAIPPLEVRNLVRGQFGGYRKEPGVAPDSKTETFAALQLEVDSWRWRGGPFFIRAGECLPVACTDVVIRLRQPPTMYDTSILKSNYLRFRISPDFTIAVGLNVMSPESGMEGEAAELIASHHAGAEEMDAYERVLGDAMCGDAT